MMMDRGPCPYLNRDDERCSKRLSLVNLPQAFGYCLAAYPKCGVYQQIRRAQETPEDVRRLPRTA